MKKCIYIGFVLFVIISWSCEKQHFNDSIIGQWQWIKSTAGENGSAVTVELYDTTHYLEFNNDGYYYMYDNSKRQIYISRYELLEKILYQSDVEIVVLIVKSIGYLTIKG
jgi:hypothetical protein